MSYIERHHDYVLGPNQDGRLASVAAGQTLSLALGLDSDAPFLLRSRAVRVAYSAGGQQTDVNHILARFAKPDRTYTSQAMIRQSLLGPYLGQLGNPIPVSPQIFYPKQSTIQVDMTNDSASALTNVTFYFRGVKLFSPGAVKSYSYPAKCSILPFTYPQQQIVNLPVTASPANRYTFRVKSDADFVLRALQAGNPLDTVPALEVFIRLFDEDEKPYSNDMVHLDVMCGNSGMGRGSFGSGTYPAFGQGFIPIGAGPNSPGLVYPEIYLPANHIFYFNISRSDTNPGAQAVNNLPLNFIGAKVFSK